MWKTHKFNGFCWWVSIEEDTKEVGKLTFNSVVMSKKLFFPPSRIFFDILYDVMPCEETPQRKNNVTIFWKSSYSEEMYFAAWKNDCTAWENDCTAWKNDCTAWKNDCAEWKNDCAAWGNDCTAWRNDCTAWKNDCAA
ncbi:MAG: hypothetical protein LBE13_22900, partial [Bacteroidales bacterium]|nr:hypothetical protein [Bacteroidales bacterium]